MNITRKKILQAAIRAPSGDNCQPWWFQFTEDGNLNIGIDSSRAKSFFDFKSRGTFLSLGAVLENIRVQAASENLRVHITYLNDLMLLDKPLVNVTFNKNQRISMRDSYIHAMETRTVNRRPYLPIKIEKSKLHWMCDDPVDDVQVNIYTSRRDIKKWAKLIYLADRIRYSHPVIHEEVFSKILLSKKEALHKRLGLEIDRLGIGPLASPIIRLLKPWKRMHTLSRFGVGRFLARQSEITGLMSGAMILITIPSNDAKYWINAGTKVQKIWIGAHEKKLCVHPMTVALYLNGRYQSEGGVNFLPEHIPLLEEIQAELKVLIPEGVGAMLFRVGHGVAMKNSSIRLPVSVFIKQ